MPKPYLAIEALLQTLREIIPGANLETVALNTSVPIELLLLNADYPQGDLCEDDMQRVMNNPLYWIFCWASGQVLAEFLMDNPHWVKNKRVLDFGCGSGVVAIAAAMAGAAEVIACDIDPLALAAAKINAQLNGVELSLTEDYFDISGYIDLIIVADVLYDKNNFVWLKRFLERTDQVLVADSRVKNFDFPPYRALARFEGRTLPDLDESAEFRDVRIYQADSAGSSGHSKSPSSWNQMT